MEDHTATATPEEDWPGLDKLRQVQELLDQNKLLIAQINQNHELKTPDALQRNHILIRQLNTNISEVLKLYTEVASMVGEGATGHEGARTEAGDMPMLQQVQPTA